MTTDNELGDISARALGAMEAAIAGEPDAIEQHVTALGEKGIAVFYAATCAWVEFVHRWTQVGGQRVNACDMPEDTPADYVLALRLIACLGNQDRETALMLYASAPMEVQVGASMRVLEVVGVLGRMRAAALS